MLVLSRKPGEKLHIGEDITLEVRRVSGNRVTIAIDAPRHIHILRGELERYANEFADAPAESGAAQDEYEVVHFRVPRKSAQQRRELASA